MPSKYKQGDGAKRTRHRKQQQTKSLCDLRLIDKAPDWVCQDLTKCIMRDTSQRIHVDRECVKTHNATLEMAFNKNLTGDRNNTAKDS